jgi:hypothetical protein
MLLRSMFIEELSVIIHVHTVCMLVGMCCMCSSNEELIIQLNTVFTVCWLVTPGVSKYIYNRSINFQLQIDKENSVCNLLGPNNVLIKFILISITRRSYDPV